MKNQNDMIFMIVAAVLSLGIGLGMFFGAKRTVTRPADPAPVAIAPAKPQEGAVVMASSLPGAGGQTGGGGGGQELSVNTGAPINTTLGGLKRGGAKAPTR